MKTSRNTIGGILALSVLLMAGCSVTGGIKPVASSKSEFEGAFYQGETTVINAATLGGEEFRVFNQGASSFVSLQANREDAEQRAAKFCGQRGRLVRPLRETVSKPPHVLGNFPRVELIFECLERAPSAAVEDVSEAKYVRLIMLKKLLDDGALTKEEFETEKRKLLGQK